MVARAKGGRKTPERITNLLKLEVERSSQAATARATGLTLRGVQNYLKGIGDPTTSTLQKLADYFEVHVVWLQGYFENMTYEKAKEYKKVTDNGNKSGWVGDVMSPEEGSVWPERYDVYAKLLSQDEVVFSIALKNDLEFNDESVKSFLDTAQSVLNMSEELQKAFNQEHLEEVKNMAMQVLRKYSTDDQTPE